MNSTSNHRQSDDHSSLSTPSALATLAAIAAGTFVALSIAASPATAAAPSAPVAPDADARLRVIHAAPFSNTLPGTSVSVRVNGVQVLTNVVFGSASTYLTVNSGVSNTVEIIPTGSLTAVLSSTVVLSTEVDYSILALGDGVKQPLELQTLIDDNVAISSTAKVRVIHAAPIANTITGTLVDLRTESGTPVVSNFPYKESTPFLPLPAGYYDLKIVPSGSVTTVLDVPPFQLLGGDLLTVLAIGDGVNQPLSLLPLGNFRPLGLARVQIVHAAPFAALLADTAVSVTVSSALGTSTPLSNVVFGQTSGGYVNLAAGLPTTITVTPMDAAAPALTATVTFSAGVDYTVAAIGNGSKQPLELYTVIDNNTPITTSAKVRVIHVAPFASTITGTLVDIRDESGAPIASNVPYKFNSDYLPIAPGLYDLKVTLPGNGPTVIDLPAIQTNGGDIVTIFAVGDGTNQPLRVLTIGDLTPAPTGRAFIAHLAPFADTLAGTAVTVDIVNAIGSRTTLTDVRFGETSGGYLPLVATVPTTITITPNGAATPVLTSTVMFSAGVDYTIAAIGNISLQPLELLTLVDDNSVISTSAKLRLVHVAPFSANTSAMIVDVKQQNGNTVQTSLSYKGHSGYLQIPGGIYDLRVLTANTNVVITDPAPQLIPNGHVQTIFILGDGSSGSGNQPFGTLTYIAKDGRRIVRLPILGRV